VENHNLYPVGFHRSSGRLSRTHTTASNREWMSNFSRTCVRCISTVRTVMDRVSAISALLKARVSRHTTSRSRSVRRSHGLCTSVCQYKTRAICFAVYHCFPRATTRTAARWPAPASSAARQAPVAAAAPGLCSAGWHRRRSAGPSGC